MFLKISSQFGGVNFDKNFFSDQFDFLVFFFFFFSVKRTLTEQVKGMQTQTWLNLKSELFPNASHRGRQTATS